MNFLKRLASFFSAPSASSTRYYWINVKCNRCGEVIRGRVDLLNDLSIDYGIGEDGQESERPGGEGNVTYFCRKVLIGEQRCYQPIEIELTFDKDHRLITQKIKGGKFIKEREDPGRE